MKHFVMVLTDKGGTGKSMFTRAIADRYARDSIKALLVDGDGEVGQLFQFYSKVNAEGSPVKQAAGNGVLTIRVTGEEKERDKLLAMLDYDLPVVLVDMPAASLTALAKMDGEVGFFDELKRSGYRATLINVLSPFQSSTRTVKQMIELAGKNADYVAVINRWFGDDEDFYMWLGDSNNSPSQGRKMLPEFDGVEIELPKLQTGVLVAMDDLMLTFSDACESPSLSRPQRSRLIRWMKDTDIQLDKISYMIGLKGKDE
jgi:hypothetical protein